MIINKSRFVDMLPYTDDINLIATRHVECVVLLSKHNALDIILKKVQNKIRYAVSGETAAEAVYHRADIEKDYLALIENPDKEVKK